MTMKISRSAWILILFHLECSATPPPPPSSTPLRLLRYCFTKISMGKWICQGHFVALIGPFHWIIRKSKVEYILKWAEKSTGFSIKCLEWSQWTWRKFNYNLKWSPLKHSEHSETLRHSMWHCKNRCQKRIFNLNLNINANKIYNCTYCMPMITNYEWNQTNINTYQTGNYSNAKVSAFFGIFRHSQRSFWLLLPYESNYFT